MFRFSNRVRLPVLCLMLAVVLPACSAASVPEPMVLATTAVPATPAPPGQRETSVAAAAPTQPQSPTAMAVTAVPTDLATRLDTLLNQLVESGDFSGAVLVARDGTVLLKKGYGLANREHDVPNTPQTKFRLGSITKQFTAMAILILQAQGKLTVQDRACMYLSDCPAAWQKISIHQLLTHTSGITNFTDFVDYSATKTQFSSPAQTIRRFKDKPLDFTPGAQWSYSNSGYIVLGAIVEQVSGLSYELFLRQNIFQPLQLADTGYDHHSAILKHRAAGYTGSDANADYIDMSIPYAAGGLYSTVEDLYRWDQALYTEGLVSKQSLEAMFSASAPIPDSSGASYGYGWGIGKQFDRRWISHGGGIDGFSTGIERYPDDKVSIIVLSNQENTDVGRITSQLAQMIFEEQ